MKRKIDGPLFQAWLNFSKYDIKTAKWNLEGNMYTSACYTAQQSAEKSLKALLIFLDKTPPKIHSLDRLITLVKEEKINTSAIEKYARTLDAYYISTRYPGQYGGPEGLYDKQDAQTAVAGAEAILDFVEHAMSEKETQVIMSDPGLMKAIKEGEEDVAAGRAIPWEDVKKKLKLD